MHDKDNMNQNAAHNISHRRSSEKSVCNIAGKKKNSVSHILFNICKIFVHLHRCFHTSSTVQSCSISNEDARDTDIYQVF